MSNEKKEELMSLGISLLSIMILLMSFVSGTIDAQAELYVLYTTFVILLSSIKPFSKIGAIICIAPFIVGWACNGINTNVVAEAVEVTTYYILGGFMNRIFVQYTIDGRYMKFLGYQTSIVICGNSMWLLFMDLTNRINTGSMIKSVLFACLLQKITITMLHMLVCNKPLTNYFADRSKDE